MNTNNYEECVFLMRLPSLNPDSPPEICLCEIYHTKQRINEAGKKELFYTGKDGEEHVTPYMFEPCLMENSCQKIEPRPKFPET